MTPLIGFEATPLLVEGSMPSFKKSDDQLIAELIEQAAELRARCAAFDDGVGWEAKAIAVSVYKLVHDGAGRSKSLLGLLGLKNKAVFVSTARPFQPPKRQHIEGNAYSVTAEVRMPPLVRLRSRSDGSWEWAARCSDAVERKELSFSNWWQETIYTDANGRDLSRKNMVFAMRSQDGGAHVDGELTDESYYWLATDANPGIRSIGSPAQGGSKPIVGGHRATMRQIGWEVDQALLGLGY